jgi:short-chain fatty acids transporter
MLRRVGNLLAERLRRYIPDAFVFAIGLTILTAISAWSLADASPLAVLDGWYRGFWILLEFGMQIVLVLATGYAIALSPMASSTIDAIARKITTPRQVYATVMVVGALLCLVSWSWVVLVAVLARELAARVRGLDYAYLTACVFISSWSWVCGLSSSIPLLLNTEDNFLIETGLIDHTIGVDVTLGSTLNLVYLAVGLVIYPGLMVALSPRAKDASPMDDRLDDSQPVSRRSVAEEAQALRLPGQAFSDRLNHTPWLPAILVAMGLVFLVNYFSSRGFDINLEIMIFGFLMVGLAVHRTAMRYVVAMKRACSNVSGIVFQYPFYAGIMGIMMFTDLGTLIAQWMAESASLEMLPAIAQFLGAAVNFAIPSAGGEWAVIGPTLVETAHTLAGDLPAAELDALTARIALAVAYGETSTNLLQPFFLLIILPVMGAGIHIQARDVMGYLVLPFTIGYLTTAFLVTMVG